jgi:glycosyltransferase involved in cell wall biosynthesis
MKPAVETVPGQRVRMVLLSHVMPLAATSGQQQRVYHSLVAFRKHFHVTFVGLAPSVRHGSLRQGLLELCDEVELLPPYPGGSLSALWHRAAGWVFQRRTGLKLSNYLIGKVGFSPLRLASLLSKREFDIALFEYFHAADSAPVFRARGIPCVLDMHNILWRSFARQLEARGVAGKARERAVERYRAAEEHAWSRFDGLIAISEGERNYAQQKLRRGQVLFYAPMGIPLLAWPYCWVPAEPPRVAYYGGLGSPHNANDARRCYELIMPHVWFAFPKAELWIVGANPPPDLQRLPERDARVRVTGFVPRAQDVLKTISVLLCPFTGTYGFRSRIIEAMALGIPVVATPDAVFGMGLEEQKGLFLAKDHEGIARAALRLLRDSAFARQQSRLAHGQVENQFSFEQSYARLARELVQFVDSPHESSLGSQAPESRNTCVGLNAPGSC